MSRVGIVIVGGNVFAAKLVEGLAREAVGPPVDLRLVARRFDRLQTITDHAARRVAFLRPSWRVRALASLEEALPGASVVVLLLRVGGLRARSHDESFPALAGLVGDEGIGLGGMANAWRTVPVLGDVARLIRIGAPDAMILNAVAPLGITTRLLLDEELPAVGICELPLVTREQLLGSHEGQSGLAYAGLNHLGWFWATDETGQRALAAGVDNGLIDRQVLEEFDAAPLHYYYDVFRPEAGRRLGRVRRENRAGELTSLAEKIFDDLRRRPGADISSFAGRPTPWFDRALIPTLAALLTGSRFHSFANVRNGDLVPAVPTAGVVEVEAEVTAEGVRTLAPQRIPEPVTRFLRAAGEAEALTYRSACERDPSLLIDAMRALPLAIPEVHVKNLAQEIVAPVEPPAA